jgi:hypothetical protein
MDIVSSPVVNVQMNNALSKDRELQSSTDISELTTAVSNRSKLMDRCGLFGV